LIQAQVLFPVNLLYCRARIKIMVKIDSDYLL